MNESDLKKMWQSYDKKIDKMIAINKEQLKALQKEKAKSSVESFVRGHFWVMICGVLWIGFLGFLLYHTIFVNLYFSISAGIILLFNVYAVAIYSKHIIILKQIDLAESIIETQRRISKVYTSFTQSGRVLLLQAPFFCTFWYTDELVQHAGLQFWLIQLVVVSFFSFGAIFLYRKLSIHHPSDTWRKRSNRYFGAIKLQKALELLKDIEEFSDEETKESSF